MQPSGGLSQSQCLRGLSLSIQPVQVQSSTGGPRILESCITIRFKKQVFNSKADKKVIFNKTFAKIYNWMVDDLAQRVFNPQKIS